jgi:hypothetical protein
VLLSRHHLRSTHFEDPRVTVNVAAMDPALDAAIVDRSFPPVGPHRVSAEKVAEFARATQWRGQGVPPTFPILLLNDAMLAFLADVGASLERIVHGEQRFAYRRPVVVGDELSATLRVASLRTLGGAEIIGTVSTITDASGEVVCEARATLVHTGAQEESTADEQTGGAA